MKADLSDLDSFVTVARAGGFRDGARASGESASALSEAVRRLEARLGARLLHRTTRSVAPTEAGARLLAQIGPAFAEIGAALDVVGGSGDQPVGTLKLNVAVSAARLVLPKILPGFLAAYPEVRVEVTAEDAFVDLPASGCDAGVRYGERLEQDMIATPIGPRTQRYAAAAAPAYLDRRGRPEHPRDLLAHECLRARFPNRAPMAWEFERDGEAIAIDPPGQLTVQAGTAVDLAVDMAVAGSGVVQLFEDWLSPYFASGALEPVLKPWWERFPGPFLYYSGRRLTPAPLRAFVDYVKAEGVWG